MKKLITLLMAIVCLMLSSCGTLVLDDFDLMAKIEADENSTYNFVNGETSAPASYTSFKQTAKDFTFKALLNLYDGGNVYLDSASLYTQLAFLENCTENTTKSQIKSVLNKNLTLEEVNNCCGYFLARLNALNSQSEYNITIDSNVVFNSNAVVSTDFLKTNCNYFNFNIYRLDYNNAQETALLKDYALPDLDSNSLVNITTNSSICDLWLNGYSEVSLGEFRGINKTSTATYLASTEYYLEGKNCTGFVKDFKNTTAKFVALLPDEDMNMNDFISSLDFDSYGTILDSLNVFTTCNAYLPEFTANCNEDYSDLLKSMGIEEVFGTEGNFNKVSFNLKGQLQSINQSSNLKITSAGANTETVSYSDITKAQANNTVKLNRPFVFFVIDNESDIPLFAGVVADI